MSTKQPVQDEQGNWYMGRSDEDEMWFWIVLTVMWLGVLILFVFLSPPIALIIAALGMFFAFFICVLCWVELAKLATKLLKTGEWRFPFCSSILRFFYGLVTSADLAWLICSKVVLVGSMALAVWLMESL